MIFYYYKVQYCDILLVWQFIIRIYFLCTGFFKYRNTVFKKKPFYCFNAEPVSWRLLLNSLCHLRLHCKTGSNFLLVAFSSSKDVAIKNKKKNIGKLSTSHYIDDFIPKTSVGRLKMSAKCWRPTLKNTFRFSIMMQNPVQPTK